MHNAWHLPTPIYKRNEVQQFHMQRVDTKRDKGEAPRPRTSQCKRFLYVMIHFITPINICHLAKR